MEESILDFNQPLNISILDQLLLKQFDSKVSNILNQFIHHPLAWSRVGDILKSTNSENIRFFGLTILENNVIKKHFSTLDQSQKSSIINELMEMVLSNTTQTSSSSLKGLIRKKSASLISQILIKEWSVSNMQFVEMYISKLLQLLDNGGAGGSTDSITIFDGIFNIFKNLASYIKQEQDYKSFNNLESIFDQIYMKSVTYLQRLNNETNGTIGLTMEILNTISLLFELVNLEYLFQNSITLYMVSRISTEPTTDVNLNNLRNTYIHVLVEHVNSILLKKQEIPINNTTAQQQYNNKIQECQPVLFKSIIEKCFKFSIDGSNGFNYNKNSILFENLTLLYTVYLKNFISISIGIPELRESILFAEKFIIDILPSLQSDRSVLCLELILSFYKSSSGGNGSGDPSIHYQFIPNLFGSCFKILNNHNQELLEDGSHGGILYDQQSNCGGSSGNSDDSSKQDEDEWMKISNLISGIFEMIGSVYFNDSFQYFTGKLETLIKNPIELNASKLGTIFWCLGYLCKNSNQFEKINEFLKLVIGGGLSNGLDSTQSENLMFGLLFFIKQSSSYLKNIQTSTSIKDIVSFITDKLLLSNIESITEMSIITLETIIKIRQYQVLVDYPNYHLYLNQIITNVNTVNTIKPLQINKLYECIGLLIYYQIQQAQDQSQHSQQEIITYILNPLIEKLQSSNMVNVESDKLAITKWSSLINNILCSNIGLAKTMKQYFKIQMNRLYPILINLQKWSNQSHEPFEKYSGSIISFKKNIIEILNIYIIQQQQSNPPSSLDQLQVDINQFLELLYQDPTISLPVYKVDVLPKTISLITTLINTFSTKLYKSTIDCLFEPFFNLSLQESFKQSTDSKGLTLLNKIWELVNSIQKNNPALLVGNGISNYFQLTEICLRNISPSIHASALESLVCYFTNIQSVPSEIINQLFNFELLLKEFELGLSLLLNSEYQSSIDKIIKLLFTLVRLTGNNENIKLSMMRLFKDKSQSSQDSKIQLLFNSNTTDNLDQFENLIKSIIHIQ